MPTTCVLWGEWSQQHDMASKRVRPPLGSKGQVGHTTATHRKSPKRVCTFRRCYYRALNGVRASSGMLARLTGCANVHVRAHSYTLVARVPDAIHPCDNLDHDTQLPPVGTTPARAEEERDSVSIARLPRKAALNVEAWLQKMAFLPSTLASRQRRTARRAPPVRRQTAADGGRGLVGAAKFFVKPCS
jgi:hypothetical protein